MTEQVMAWPFIPNWTFAVLVAIVAASGLLMLADEPARDKRWEWLSLPMLTVGAIVIVQCFTWNWVVGYAKYKVHEHERQRWTQDSDPYRSW